MAIAGPKVRRPRAKPRRGRETETCLAFFLNFHHGPWYTWPSCRASTTRRHAVPCRHGTTACRPCWPCRPCRACPCHGPGHRPTARHMGRISVPCRPWATAIFTVPCWPTARQSRVYSKLPVLSFNITKIYRNLESKELNNK